MLRSAAAQRAQAEAAASQGQVVSGFEVVERLQNRELRLDIEGHLRCLALRFESPQEFVTVCSDLGVQSSPSADPRYLNSPKMGYSYFYGNAHSRQGTIDKVKKASVDPHVVAEAERIEQEMMKWSIPQLDKRKSSKPYRSPHQFGATLDYGRYYSGDPDCFYRIKRDNPQRVIRIGVNFAVVYLAKADVFIKLAAMLYAASKSIERLGYPTEIVAHSSTYGWNTPPTIKEFAIMLYLKEAGDRFDLEKIMSIALPGLSRDFSWGLQEIYGEHYDILMGKDNDFGHDGRKYGGVSPEMKKLLGCHIEVGSDGGELSERRDFIRACLDNL